MQRSKSAPTRSILFAKMMRGTPYRSAWRHTVSVCGSTPATESSSVTAPSSTRSERSTSTVKSTWPGVSMMLMRYSMPLRVQKAGRRGRRDRDAALLLLLHPVHRGGAFMHLADLVRLAGVVQDALGRSRLTGIDVGHDADIPIVIERSVSRHNFRQPVPRRRRRLHQAKSGATDPGDPVVSLRAHPGNRPGRGPIEVPCVFGRPEVAGADAPRHVTRCLPAVFVVVSAAADARLRLRYQR